MRGNIPATHPFKLFPPLTPVFTPVQISGCGLWLDAADRSTFTLSGSNVTAITDKSGTKTVTVTSTPTYNSSNFNGLPSFVFTSGTRFSVTTSALGQNFSLVGVYRVTGTSGPSPNAVPIAVGSPASGNETGMGWNGGSLYYNFYDFGSGEGNTTVVSTINVNLIHVGVKSSSAPNMLTTVNGTVGTTGTSSYSNANTTINVGNAGTNFGFLGNLAEAIVYSNALSVSQRQVVEGYLASKWGLLDSLPSTHPYKKIRP